MSASAPVLETDRLILRGWCTEDRAPFAALNADPDVMHNFPSTLTREESDAFVDTIDAAFAEFGFGLWAVELRGGDPFVGYVGLAVPTFDAPFMPCVEVGWRLARDAWGKGYASEAAREVLHFAFATLELDDVVSFTAAVNAPSQRVMQAIGMSYGCEFDHPRIDAGHRLQRHLLYRINRSEWSQLGVEE